MGSQGDGTVQFLCKGVEGMEAAAAVLANDFGLDTIRVVIPSAHAAAAAEAATSTSVSVASLESMT